MSFRKLLMLVLLAVPLAGATDRYVSPGGSGSTCSSGSPCSASTGISATNAGDTLHFLPSGSSYGCITTAHSGTSGSRIVYISDTQYGAKISCNSTVVWQNNGSYVDINGFEVTSTGSSSCEGIRSVASFVHTIRNYIHDIPAISATCGNGGDGFAFGWNGNHGTNSDNLGDSNIVDMVGFANGSCPNMHGIYGSTPRNKFTNNIVTRSCGWGIQTYHDSTTAVISNNVFAANLRGGILVGASDGTSHTNATIATSHPRLRIIGIS